MKPTLFILAAGLGSRYSGLKQMDGVGPCGETIPEYSVYDAIRVGFGKVVFVIRRSFEDAFRKFVDARFGNKIPVELVFQEIDDLPDGYKPHPDREKPWGTNHAVLTGRDVINEPFLVINADDFYGKESYEIIYDFLKSVQGKTNLYGMVGYRIRNTLSESGSVSRGICRTDENGFLTDVVERMHIERIDGSIMYKDENGNRHIIPENTPVSMNMWAFTPDYFEHSVEYFREFLKERGRELNSEFFIPLAVNFLIKSGKAAVKVFDTPTQWFGITYREDRPAVMSEIKQLIDQGIYPSNLWK